VLYDRNGMVSQHRNCGRNSRSHRGASAAGRKESASACWIGPARSIHNSKTAAQNDIPFLLGVEYLPCCHNNYPRSCSSSFLLPLSLSSFGPLLP